MKTITEFSGFPLREALAIKREIYPAPPQRERPDRKHGHKGKPIKKIEPIKPVKKDEVQAAPVAQEQVPATEATEPTTPVQEQAVVVEAQDSETEVSVDTATTVTEQIVRESMGAPAAPTPEELKAKLSQALTEKFKVEGEKLEWMINALEVVDFRRVRDLKRVVVYAATEGEKVPSHFIQKGSHYFLAEYMASLNPPRPKGRFGKGPRGRKGGKRGGGKGRRFDKSRRNDSRRPQDHEAQASEGGASKPVIKPVIKPVVKPVQPASES